MLRVRLFVLCRCARRCSSDIVINSRDVRTTTCRDCRLSGPLLRLDATTLRPRVSSHPSIPFSLFFAHLWDVHMLSLYTSRYKRKKTTITKQIICLSRLYQSILANRMKILPRTKAWDSRETLHTRIRWTFILTFFFLPNFDSAFLFFFSPSFDYDLCILNFLFLSFDFDLWFCFVMYYCNFYLMNFMILLLFDLHDLPKHMRSSWRWNFTDCGCSCGMHALLTSDLQERPGDAYVPASVARSTSCPNSNTALLSKEAKDLKGPYLLVPGIV